MTQMTGAVQSIVRTQGSCSNVSAQSAGVTEASEFQEVLRQKTEAEQESTKSDLKFSKHANERLVSRNISLTRDQVERLQDGVVKAREKGIQESLVLLDNLSFIVNVKNDTVVTALDQGCDAKQIFTNIDGAVIV